MDSQLTLHIVRGLPGTGKTTFVQRTYPGMLQIENDQVWVTPDGKYEYIEEGDPRGRVRDYVRAMVTTAMKQKVNIAVSRVGCSIGSVKELVELAEAHGYKYRIYLMDPDNLKHFKNVHDVPEEALKSMKEHFIFQLPYWQTLVTIHENVDKCTGAKSYHPIYKTVMPKASTNTGEEGCSQ